MNPIALEAIQWRYYLVYVGLLAIISTVICLFYAETKGYSLEEISDIFEGPAIIPKHARHLGGRREDREVTDAEKEPPVVEIENAISAGVK